jgi:hypothetical protein
VTGPVHAGRAARVTVLCLALGLCGCGAARPGRGDGALQRAERTHEYPSPVPARQRAPGAASAIKAISAFASTYINWSPQTVASQMRSLARASIGQARAAMSLAAAQTSGDYELQRGGVSNQGTVEAVAPLAGHRGEYLVVTREVTTATDTTVYQGLQPAWHVTLAAVTELTPGRWVLSGWQPES